MIKLIELADQGFLPDGLIRFGIRRLDKNHNDIMPIMQDVYGRKDAGRWFQRWRIFFMACAELWGYRNGQEWLVSHYRLRKK